jgi:hypothetical protein
MDEPAWKLDDYGLKPLTPPPHHTVDADNLEYHDYALVVTGDVFRWLINHAPLETLQRVRQNADDHIVGLTALTARIPDVREDTDIRTHVPR